MCMVPGSMDTMSCTTLPCACCTPGLEQVPEKQRKEWSTLFRSYITRRSSLRVLFHLIDGRHGPVGQDHAIMKLMAELPDTARFVLVVIVVVFFCFSGFC